MLIPIFSTVMFTKDTKDRWIEPKKASSFLQQLPTHLSNIYLSIVLLQEIASWLVKENSYGISSA